MTGLLLQEGYRVQGMVWNCKAKGESKSENFNTDVFLDMVGWLGHGEWEHASQGACAAVV